MLFTVRHDPWGAMTLRDTGNALDRVSLMLTVPSSSAAPPLKVSVMCTVSFTGVTEFARSYAASPESEPFAVCAACWLHVAVAVFVPVYAAGCAAYVHV